MGTIYDKEVCGLSTTKSHQIFFKVQNSKHLDFVVSMTTTQFCIIVGKQVLAIYKQMDIVVSNDHLWQKKKKAPTKSGIPIAVFQSVS